MVSSVKDWPPVELAVLERRGIVYDNPEDSEDSDLGKAGIMCEFVCVFSDRQGERADNDSAVRKLGLYTSQTIDRQSVGQGLSVPVKGAQTPDETGEPLAGFAPLNFTEEVR